MTQRAINDLKAVEKSQGNVAAAIKQELKMVETKIHDYKATQTHGIWLNPWIKYRNKLENILDDLLK